MLWQLKKLSTGETLSEAQNLPENWGPIFGMAGIQDRLGDLSWLGEAFADQGWVQVESQPAEQATIETKAAEVNRTIARLLEETSVYVAVDNTQITKSARADWIDYRQALRNIPTQPRFPEEITWPIEPA